MNYSRALFLEYAQSRTLQRMISEVSPLVCRTCFLMHLRMSPATGRIAVLRRAPRDVLPETFAYVSCNRSYCGLETCLIVIRNPADARSWRANENERDVGRVICIGVLGGANKWSKNGRCDGHLIFSGLF